MQFNQNLGRVKFIKIISYALIVPLIYGWVSMLKQNRLLQSGSNTLVLPPDLPNGLSFVEPVIINNTKKGIEVYSARCTHLGCMINHIENDRLICPCHGSEYLPDGSVVKGPSKKPLNKLSYAYDSEKKAIIVKLA